MNDMTQYARVYPEDAVLANRDQVDAIDPTTLNSIPELFAERCNRTPNNPAYLFFSKNQWQTLTWADFAQRLQTWRNAFAREGLATGARVAIRSKNCVEWILFDQGAMGRGLVVVPVFAEDRADNIAYIVEQTESAILFLENLEQWQEMADEARATDCLQRIIIKEVDEDSVLDDPRLISLDRWLAYGVEQDADLISVPRDQLATIVYTSGTTGRPKGVMLSHENIMGNAYAGLQSIAVFPEDRMLSFLPLSHMFERTIGCYFNVIAGSSVAFNRSIPELLDDMAMVKPTIIITVPRIFERAYSRIKEQLDEGSGVKKWLFEKAVNAGWRKFNHAQGRASWHPSILLSPLLDKLVGAKVRDRFGGNLRFVVSGGAPLAARISEVFVGLGVNILQGYGLTEASPVLTVNTLDRNKPDTIGLPLLGAELRVVETGELQARSSGIMMGYWQNPDATNEVMTEDGWLMTGDVAKISDQGFISITGRIKEIIVLANGEKVPPADMESAISDDPVFEQVMIVGEGKPYLSALIVVNTDVWDKQATTLGFDGSATADFNDQKVHDWACSKVAKLVADFPGYANIHRVTLSTDPWTVEGGALTQTLKITRPVLRERFAAEIDSMYSGH